MPKDLKSDIDAIIKETQNSITQIKTEINKLISNIKADIKISDVVEFLTDMNKTQNQIITKLNSAASTLKIQMYFQPTLAVKLKYWQIPQRILLLTLRVII